MSTATSAISTTMQALRRLGRRPTSESAACELCSAAIATEHEHLCEPATGRIVCTCGACAILFSNHGDQKYRRVPREIYELANFALSDELWDNLGIPIGLAFFYRSTAAGAIVAVYPSPVGPMRAEPASETWAELSVANPCLTLLEPDAEALLVNRIDGARDYFRVGIDQCYTLVGLIRARWRGISGGPDVWNEMQTFFAALRQRAVHG